MAFPSPGNNTILEVPAPELRAIFNALEIARKGRQRILIRKPGWSGRRRPRHLAVGTRSRTWFYFVPNQDNWLLAVAHIYLQRGAPIGEPDPKELRIDQLVLRPGYAQTLG